MCFLKFFCSYCYEVYPGCVLVTHTDKNCCLMFSHTIKVCIKRSQEDLAGEDVLYLDHVPLDIHAPSLTLFVSPLSPVCPLNLLIKPTSKCFKIP